MSDPSAPFSKLRERRSKKRCPDKQITAPDLWPSIRLHGLKLQDIKLLNIKPHGIVPHSAKLLGISNLNRDLFLPSKMANPRLTNPSTSKSRKRWRMINIARSYLFGCRA
jgi:hypothetical protein